MKPEEALGRAREAAAAARARGAYGEDLSGFRIEPTDVVSPGQLLEWALIEPDAELVYSTRRWGRPITWFKRALIHALRQYTGQMLAQQVRFNLQLTVYATELEDRVRELERRLDEER